MRKFLFLMIFTVFGFAQSVSVLGGINNIDGNFQYKGTQNSIKDIGIDKIYNFGIKANIDDDSFIPGILADISYFTSFSKNTTLNKNIIIDNTPYNANEKITSKLSYTNINLIAYYTFFKTPISYLRFGVGFLGNIGSLKIDGNQKYSHINFKFYYPTLYTQFMLHTKHFLFGFGGSGTGLFSLDTLGKAEIFTGYKLKSVSFKIGYKYTKMKIDNYDDWYSDLTTSGVYFEISKSF